MGKYFNKANNKATISSDFIVQFEVFFFFIFTRYQCRDYWTPLYDDFIQSIPELAYTFFMTSWCFWPEIFLLISIIFLTLHKNVKFTLFMRFNLTGLLLILSYWSVIYLTVTTNFFTHFYFSNYYFFDYYVFVIKLIFFIIFVFFLSIIYFRFFDEKKIKLKDVEFYRIVYILFLSFWLFSFLLISSNNLFGFYFILEGLSFLIIFSCVLNFNKAFCLLTSIRYFTLNAFASGCFLFSIIILHVFYQTTDLFFLKNLFSLSGKGVYAGSTSAWTHYYKNAIRDFDFIPYSDSWTDISNVLEITRTITAGLVPYSILLFFIFFMIGCFFKLGCFPFNWWILSINLFINYETFFLFNVIFKNLFFFYFFRMITYYFSALSPFWIPLFLFIGFTTLMIGTIGLFSQKRLKGFFTFSSMIQIGYVFIGISLTTIESFTSVFFLHLIYLLNSAVVFSILLYFSSDARAQQIFIKSRNVFFALADLSLLRLLNPLIAITFTLAILSFAGLPPTLGFFAKYYYFEVLVKMGLYKLCIILLVLNAISLYPYINLLKNLWFITNIKSFSENFLPVFSYEYFLVGTFRYYIFFNFSAIFFYKFIIECCHKLSYHGARVVFTQWFDELSRQEQKYIHFLHSKIIKKVTKFYLERKRQPELYNNIYSYGGGFDHSILLDRNTFLNSYVTFSREMDIAGIDYLLNLDNFSDSFWMSASKFDIAAFTLIGITTLWLIVDCFSTIYIREEHIESRDDEILLSWWSFGGGRYKPFLYRLRDAFQK